MMASRLSRRPTEADSSDFDIGVLQIAYFPSRLRNSAAPLPGEVYQVVRCPGTMGLWVLAHNEIDAMCCDDDDPFFGFVREDRGSHNDSARVDSAVASYLLGDDVYHDFLLAGYVICCKVIGIRFSETYIKRETEAQVFYDEDNVNIFGTAYFWVELRRPVSLVSYTGCPLGISASLPISQLPPTLQSYDDGSVNDRGMSFWKRKIEASLQNITGGVEMIPWFGGSTRSTECPERAICAFARHLGVYGCTDPYVLAVDIVLSVFDLRDDDAMGPRLAELIRMPDEVMAQAMGFPHPHCHIQRQLLAEAYVMLSCKWREVHGSYPFEIRADRS